MAPPEPGPDGLDSGLTRRETLAWTLALAPASLLGCSSRDVVEKGDRDEPAASQPSTSGQPQVARPTPATSGPRPAPRLFRVGHDFRHDPGTGSCQLAARVWAHASAQAAGPRPLLIMLHGNNGAGYLQQDFPQLFGPPTELEGTEDRGRRGSLHVGELLSPLIEQGRVVPLVVACPSMRANGLHLWRAADFDLSRFVSEVQAELAALARLAPEDPEHARVEIDLARVVVAGHSGAGGHRETGLGVVAGAGAQLTVGERTYPLAVLGLMDTAVTRDLGASIREGLAAKGNRETAVSALFRAGVGGWGARDHDPAGFWEGLVGKAADESPRFVPDARFEDAALVGSPSFGDPAARPTRLSILLDGDKAAALEADRARWSALPPGPLDSTRARAFRRYDAGFGSHFDAVAIWTEWAARRFFHP